MARLGYLDHGGRSGNPYVAAVQERLRQLGWIEGQNMISESRNADGRVERLPDLARDLARRKVDVIVAMETSAAHAAKEAVSDVPIVFAASDPRRLVGNLARPGGHLTGVTNVGTDIAGKQMELLKEMVPTATRRLRSRGRTARRPRPSCTRCSGRALGSVCAWTSSRRETLRGSTGPSAP